MVRRALQLFLVALFCWPITIEIIGFLSPFWGQFYLNDKTGAADLVLLGYFRPYLPLFSLLFSWATCLLAWAQPKHLIRVACVVLGLLFSLSSFYGFLSEQTIAHILLKNCNWLLFLLMLFAFLSMLLRWHPIRSGE